MMVCRWWLVLLGGIGVFCAGAFPSWAASTRVALHLKKTNALAGAQVLTCEQASEYALKNSPEYRAALAKIRVYIQKLRASRLFPTNPALEVLGKGKLKTAPGKIEPLPYKWENSLTWKLPIGGRWIRRQRLAKATLTRVQQDVRVKRMAILLKVRSFCYKLLVAKQKRKLYSELVAFYKRVFDLVNRRKQAGAATILDLNLVRMELLQNQAALSLAIAEVKVQRQGLIAQMGWVSKTPLDIKDKVSNLLLNTASLVNFLKLSQGHVVLKAIQLKVRELQAMLAWARAKGIPDFKLKLYYALEDSWVHVIGGGIEVPLPFIQRNQDKVWSTEAKIREARLQFRAARFRIQQKVKQAFTMYQANLNVLQLYEKQLLPTFKQQLQLQERGLRLGSFTILKVISAQQSQNKALLQRIEVLKKTLQGVVTLQEAVGSMIQ
ncbi:MAG: TolC family protein [Deltaproteobacteria bacterium]|nr:MAG: TolC family protein [Deltaproteobacteria bacterium]